MITVENIYEEIIKSFKEVIDYKAKDGVSYEYDDVECEFNIYYSSYTASITMWSGRNGCFINIKIGKDQDYTVDVDIPIGDFVNDGIERYANDVYFTIIESFFNKI